VRALLTMLRRRAQALWLWQALFVLAIAWGFVSTHLAEQAAMGRMRFVAMDSRDSFYLDSAASFTTAQHIHAELARLAADTIFSRSPEGYEAPERLERLFNPEMTNRLNKEAARDADVFRQQQIHESFESSTIREISVDNTIALVSIEGQVLRNGVFNGRPTVNTKKVTLFFKLAVNDSMATNGRYPLVVVNYEERFE
jgi:hypothetical protein